MKKQWLALLCATILVCDSVYEIRSCLVVEKAALLDLKEYAFPDWPNDIALSSWVYDSKSNCCAWERVTCDSSSGHVIHLSLDSLLGDFHDIPIDHLVGVTLNLSVFTPFKQLTNLNLSDNIINDWIPREGYRSSKALKMLETLDLSNNLFNSSILNLLSGIASLKNLILSDCYLLQGSFQALANLTNVEVLRMANCHINGLLPTQSLCQMKNLQELDFSGNNFEGTLPTCFGNLTSLRVIDLTFNEIGGIIPSSSIARLASLEYLSLAENNFEGLLSLSSFANNSKLKVLVLGGFTKKLQLETENIPWIPSFQLEVLEIMNCQVNFPSSTIPTFLSYQRSLKYIYLSFNNLVGMFPTWLFENNTKIAVALLNDNSFTGDFQLPADASEHMHKLLYLKISNNKIQGILPKSIGFILPNLIYLNVSSNMFHGEIPGSIGDMSSLIFLDLANNNFSGEIPKHMLLGCPSLRYLRLSNNHLRGQIFNGPINWAQLAMLMMDNNNFSGTLGEVLLSMPFLIKLDLSGNELSGKLPTWLDNPTLNYLSVAQNNFEGALPEELCKLVYLNVINLSYNRFSGEIPSCLGFSSTYIISIHLQGNSFNGTIPDTLLRREYLLTLDLRDNKFSGYIPSGIHRLKNLKLLLLGGNQLKGELPNQICQLKELSFLDLSRNNFIGSIPTCLNNMSFGKSSVAFTVVYIPFLYDQDYNFQKKWFEEDTYLYSIQEEVQLLTKSSLLSYKGDILNYMSGLDLSSNQLTGEIPQQIGDLLSLHALNLSHNNLNGSIPESFHKLQELESLDLSCNKLSGKFPVQLQDMNSLAIFNVSYNNLSGRVPDKGQFGTFDENSYKGNPYLSWENSNRGTPPPPPSTSSKVIEEDDSAIDFTTFYWSFAASYVMVLFILVTILWINPLWRRMWLYFIDKCLYKCFYQFR